MWVITGALGVGKTTAITQLMANKPPAENWIVILNEFTESGIDALTVAGGARGTYDVRLVPGGCLCCTGELDFARQLRELTRSVRPDRILIEPSGIGHPAAITDELLRHQSRGSLLVESIVCLIDPARLAAVSNQSESVEGAQAEVSDALLLAKSDLATTTQRAAFAALAGGFFPPKSFVGEMQHGRLPTAALADHQARQRTARPRAPAHQAHRHTDEAEVVATHDTMIGSFAASRDQRRHLDREVLSWVIARDAVFARIRLRELAGQLPGVERFKGVFRTGPETWLLVQRSATGVTLTESAWRRDSRAEALYSEATAADAAGLERSLSAALAR